MSIWGKRVDSWVNQRLGRGGDNSTTKVRKPFWRTDGAVALVIVVIIGAFVLWDQLDLTGDVSSDARDNCREAVTERLADPASADFSVTDSSVQETTTGFTVTGTLTAENGLGIEETLSFRCTTTDTGIVRSTQVLGD